MTDAVDPFEAIKVTFFQECDELLGDLETGLLAIEAGSADDETINAVFRAVHSVKGGAGAFGLDDLVRFAHVFETLMDELRSGRKSCDPETVKALLRASDVLADHVSAARGQGAPVDAARSAALVAELEMLTSGGTSADVPEIVESGLPEADEFGFRPVVFDLSSLGAAAPEVPEGWRVTFRPHARMYAKANETGLLLRELARLGPVSTYLDLSALPDIDALSAEEAYLTWILEMDGTVEEADIREVFDFVEADCDLTIEPMTGDAPTPAEETVPDFDIAALLARAAADVVEPAAAPTPAPVAAAAPIASVAPVAAASPAAPAAVTIRVDLDRVDRLINLVGELVINQAMLSQSVIENDSNGALLDQHGSGGLQLLTREIQDSVMAIRAQPVKPVFQRMARTGPRNRRYDRQSRSASSPKVKTPKSTRRSSTSSPSR
jgi:two-component system chemotaxis sensor kinase CheA